MGKTVNERSDKKSSKVAPWKKMLNNDTDMQLLLFNIITVGGTIGGTISFIASLIIKTPLIQDVAVLAALAVLGICIYLANAVMGAREMYLAEGFKDYISKPVQPEVLEDILMRYIPEDKLVDSTVCDEDRESPTRGAGTVDEKTDVMGKQNKAAEESCAAEKCENMTRDGFSKQDSDISCKEVHIDHEKGLTYCGGSEDFLKEIISMYAADDKRTEIQKAYDEKDWDSYRILIHTVKSTSRTIGAMELGDEAQKLENAVKELDVDMICKMHDSVMASYSAVLDWCRVTTAQ